MLNALTIDVEDYYHVTGFESVIQRADWDVYESRVEHNTLRLLDLLETHQTRATFFVLGWVAERHQRRGENEHLSEPGPDSRKGFRQTDPADRRGF